MDEKWTLGILGLYTVIYLVVFFIQKSQIYRQKDVITSMKTFMDIFKVDEVEKYVELKEKRLIMSFNDVMKDDKYLKDLMVKIFNEKSDEIKLILSEQFGEKYLELSKLALKIAINQKPELRKSFIKDVLPLNQEFLLELLEDYQNSTS
jgi:hypothetical protein